MRSVSGLNGAWSKAALFQLIDKKVNYMHNLSVWKTVFSTTITTHPRLATLMNYEATNLALQSNRFDWRYTLAAPTAHLCT